MAVLIVDMLLVPAVLQVVYGRVVVVVQPDAAVQQIVAGGLL